MDENRVAGTMKSGVGKVERGVGGALGDTRTEQRGNLRDAAGQTQDTYGQAKDTVRGMADQASGIAGQVYEQASDLAGHAYEQAADLAGQAYDRGGRYYRQGSRMLGRQMESSPIAAILLAGAVGYLTAYLVHRRD